MEIKLRGLRNSELIVVEIREERNKLLSKQQRELDF